MTAFLSMLLRRLLFLWVLFAANALVPSRTSGYDAQIQPNIAYDGAFLSAFDYDYASMSLADEKENRCAGTSRAFAKFAELFAAKKPPIIIGENMDHRVEVYADRVGGQAYRPWNLSPWDRATAMRRNERRIRDQRRAGREIIDIGPDFQRRADTGYISDFYEMERRNLKGYENYRKAFERSGSTGGVPGLDF